MEESYRINTLAYQSCFKAVIERVENEREPLTNRKLLLKSIMNPPTFCETKQVRVSTVR